MNKFTKFKPTWAILMLLAVFTTQANVSFGQTAAEEITSFSGRTLSESPSQTEWAGSGTTWSSSYYKCMGGNTITSPEINWQAYTEVQITANIRTFGGAKQQALEVYLNDQLLGSIKPESKNLKDATISITPTAAGQLVFKGDGKFTTQVGVGVKSITITGKKAEGGKQLAGIEYAVTEHSVVFGNDFTPPTLINPNKLVPTYSIECNPAGMAEIDANTGSVTIKSTGVATITATTPEDQTYYEGIASYTLKVTKSPANISFPTESYTINVGEDFIEPTLTNPNNLTPTYSITCNPEGMAAIDAQTGEVTVNGVGKATITASTAETDGYEAATASYTLTVIDPNEKYTLLTDASTLKPGDVFIIIGKDDKTGKAHAMQKYADGNNNCRQTTDEITISEDGCVYSPSAEAARMTLGGEKDKWTLFDGTYYLYAASSSSNHLKGKNAPEDDNDKATITTNTDGTTSINFNGTNRSHLRYNLNSKLFSCYSTSTSQEPLYIYIKETSKPETGSFTIGEDKYTTYHTEKAFVMPAGATGGIITAADKSNGTLTIDYRYTEGKTVPAKTALLIKGEPKTYEYTCAQTTEAADPDNMLHATVNAEGYTHVEGTDVKYYMLSHSSDLNKFGFYWGEANGAPFKNKAPHAYLAITNATQAPAMFSIEGGEGTTGIGSIETETSAKTGVYSVTGVYMGAKTDNLPAGIYIKDGKKIIKK